MGGCAWHHNASRIVCQPTYCVKYIFFSFFFFLFWLHVHSTWHNVVYPIKMKQIECFITSNEWYAKVLNILLSNYFIYMPGGSDARRHLHLPLSGYRFFFLFSSTRISFSLHHAFALTLEWKIIMEKKQQTNLNNVTSRTRKWMDKERKRKKKNTTETESEGNQNHE